MEIRFDDYLFSDNKDLLQFEAIVRFLSQSYWAQRRSEAKIKKSIDHSLCYGVYYNRQQIGFARVVTDGATVYWLCDVFVDEAHRGKGVGKRLIEAITQSEELKNLFGILGTRDAHGLYEQYGFKTEENKYMGKLPDFLRKNSESNMR